MFKKKTRLANHFSMKSDFHRRSFVQADELALRHVVGGVVPGQYLHHRAHLHPPLLLRTPEREVRVLLQILSDL